MISVNVTKQDRAAILKIEGEVDLYSSPKVRKSLLQLIKEKMPVVVVNLEAVNYLDSSGVATLIEGLQEIGKYSGSLRLCSPTQTVKHVFELSNLDKIFEIYESVDEALGR